MSAISGLPSLHRRFPTVIGSARREARPLAGNKAFYVGAKVHKCVGVRRVWNAGKVVHDPVLESHQSQQASAIDAKPRGLEKVVAFQARQADRALQTMARPSREPGT